MTTQAIGIPINDEKDDDELINFLKTKLLPHIKDYTWSTFRIEDQLFAALMEGFWREK